MVPKQRPFRVDRVGRRSLLRHRSLVQDRHRRKGGEVAVTMEDGQVVAYGTRGDEAIGRRTYREPLATGDAVELRRLAKERSAHRIFHERSRLERLLDGARNAVSLRIP